MFAYDFEYDGFNLSDLGYTLCQLNGGDIETVVSGSKITFNKTPTMRGTKHELTSYEYTDCLEATFQICKNPCNNKTLEISVDELRELSRWLNRTEFHKFKLIHEEMIDIFFEATFNISEIRNGNKIIGLELAMETNRPFGLLEPKSTILNITKKNETVSIINTLAISLNFNAILCTFSNIFSLFNLFSLLFFSNNYNLYLFI